MRKYKNGSARRTNWDYGSNGSYFITICTENKECYFGAVNNRKMHHSEQGKIVRDVLNEIPGRFSYAILGPFVIMPNHIHVIITIDKPSDGYIDFVGARFIARLNGNPTPQHGGIKAKSRDGGFAGLKNPMVNQNISRIVHWLKGRSSYEIHKMDKKFKWQPRFHDIIIENDYVYRRMSRYIENNPANWERDKRFK